MEGVLQLAQCLYDLDIEEIGSLLSDEPKYRAGQIFSALHRGGVRPNVPKEVWQRLCAQFNCELPSVVKMIESADGTKKLLVDFSGSLVEMVILDQDYGKTVCISSQVGCKMGCAFCASGADGFVRNLSGGEMVSQVVLANKIVCEGGGGQKISHVVVMGSGEPFDNFDNTVKFLRLVTAREGINIGARNISVSTSGIVPKIKEFADLGLQVNLCISLHAPNDEIRQRLMPIAKVYPIGDLIGAAKYFFEKTHRRVIFEYSLVNGVNCAPEHAVELSRLLRGFPAHVNLINLNRTTTSKLQPPSRATSMRFMDTLIKSGMSCTMRKSRGDDIAAACGQLKTKFVVQEGHS